MQIRNQHAAQICVSRVHLFFRTLKINSIESYQFLNIRSIILKAIIAPAVFIGSLRLTVQLYRLDYKVHRQGFRRALIWILHKYYAPSQGYSPPQAIQNGPLLVLCNHPGLGDFLALLEQLPRQDVRVIVKQRELLADKQALLSHCIVMNDSVASKARALKEGIRHVQQGGCLVVFPAGEIEDDLKPWMPVADSIARRCMRAGIPLGILPAAIDNVYHVPVILRPWINSAQDAATRSGRAAIITMLTPRRRTKSIRVRFLEVISMNGSAHQTDETQTDETVSLTEKIRTQISDRLQAQESI